MRFLQVFHIVARLSFFAHHFSSRPRTLVETAVFPGESKGIPSFALSSSRILEPCTPLFVATLVLATDDRTN